MREYGINEIYDYITDGGKVTDKDTIRRNSERLLDIVHNEFQVEGRKRARLSRASKESIDAGIASEEARFQESVNAVIAQIAAKSTIPHWKDRVEQAQVAAGFTSRHKRYFYYPVKWFVKRVAAYGLLFYFAPLVGRITIVFVTAVYNSYTAAVFSKGSFSKVFSDFSNELPGIALCFLWPFRVEFLSVLRSQDMIIGACVMMVIQQSYPYRFR